MIRSRAWMCWTVLVLLAACAAPNNPSAPVADPIARPSSEAPVATDARAASKVHVELGTAYLQSGRPGVALDEARVAVAYDRSYASAHLLMALIYGDLEQFELAAPSFEEAARLAPGDPEVNNAYGWFLCARGRETEGLQRLEQAARNPYYRNPSIAWANAGLCYLRLRDDAAAEQRFLRAIQADENNRQALYRLADIGLRNGRYQRAKQWADMLVQKTPAPTEEVLWMALRIERKLGNKDAVASYAAKLRRDFPGSNEYQDFLQGKFE
jgi:type IV pilus assembly protein PilF